MWNMIRTKHKHLFQNLNRKRKKSGQKYTKAMEWYLDLLKKEKKEGTTKWIEKTRVKCDARLKKYGITQTMLDKFVTDKGLKDLLA